MKFIKTTVLTIALCLPVYGGGSTPISTSGNPGTATEAWTNVLLDIAEDLDSGVDRRGDAWAVCWTFAINPWLSSLVLYENNMFETGGGLLFTEMVDVMVLAQQQGASLSDLADEIYDLTATVGVYP